MHFMQMCGQSGLLQLIEVGVEVAPPFASKAKASMQRLVLDIRIVNALFKPSPYTEVWGPKHFPKMRLASRTRPSLPASTSNQCGICLPSVTGDETRKLGIMYFAYGGPCLEGSAGVDVALVVLPIGFSWTVPWPRGGVVLQ